MSKWWEDSNFEICDLENETYGIVTLVGREVEEG